MAIGERIRFFRNLRGMTQKYLGMQVGFPEKTAVSKSLSLTEKYVCTWTREWVQITLLCLKCSLLGKNRLKS